MGQVITAWQTLAVERGQRLKLIYARTSGPFEDAHELGVTLAQREGVLFWSASNDDTGKVAYVTIVVVFGGTTLRALLGGEWLVVGSSEFILTGAERLLGVPSLLVSLGSSVQGAEQAVNKTVVQTGREIEDAKRQVTGHLPGLGTVLAAGLGVVALVVGLVLWRTRGASS